MKGKGRAILCKLDIEKTYDHVEWPFLFSVMEKLCFGEKWIRWKKWCVSTTSFSVLVNDTPSGFFQSSRGLRQRDPLSPYLFVVVREALNCLIKRAVSGGFLLACQVRGKGVEEVKISHLLFADDRTFLSWLLMWFEAISGLKVNLDKSELIPVGNVEYVEELASELGCKVGSLPSTYLRMLLGALFKFVAAWGMECRRDYVRD